MARRSGISTVALASATLVIALITAAGVFSLYTGVAPVARVTFTSTTSLTSTQTSVTTLPAQILTSTTTLPAATSTATSITTLPAQIVSVTQTTTATTTHTTTTITTATVTDTSQIKNLTDILNLKRSTVLLNQTTLTEPKATTCTNYPGCVTPGFRRIYDFPSFTYAGYLIVKFYSTNATSAGTGNTFPWMQASWTVNGVGYSVGESFGTDIPYSNAVLVPGTMIIPVLPSMTGFQIYIYNYAAKGVTESISISYQY